MKNLEEGLCLMRVEQTETVQFLNIKLRLRNNKQGRSCGDKGDGWPLGSLSRQGGGGGVESVLYILSRHAFSGFLLLI